VEMAAVPPIADTPPAIADSAPHAVVGAVGVGGTSHWRSVMGKPWPGVCGWWRQVLPTWPDEVDELCHNGTWWER